MEFEFMSASEAKAMAEDCKVKVSDEDITKMVDGVNERIAYAAQLGEFECKIYVDDLFGMVGLKNLSVYYLKVHTLTIINGLRRAGYTVELVSNYTDEWFLHIDISW